MSLEAKIKWSKVKHKPEYSCGLDVYLKHYPGLTRGQLQKVNSGLYVKITREGNLDKIPYSYKAWAKHKEDKSIKKEEIFRGEGP